MKFFTLATLCILLMSIAPRAETPKDDVCTMHIVLEEDGAIGITVPCVSAEGMTSLAEDLLSHGGANITPKLHKLLQAKPLTLTLTTKQAN
jgi:hypothetical protein